MKRSTLSKVPSRTAYGTIDVCDFIREPNIDILRHLDTEDSMDNAAQNILHLLLMTDMGKYLS
jgi:hypothetical protein